MINSDVNLSGHLRPRLIVPQKAPLTWRLRNSMRVGYVHGLLANWLSQTVARITGNPTLTSELGIVLTLPDGQQIDYGVVSRRVVTTAFVNYVVDQLQTETSTFGDYKFHDSGVGTTAAAITDTDIETTDAESRATGTQAEGASANIYQSVGTITYTAGTAVTEHGLFNVVTAGTLMDRHVFAVINVPAAGSIEFTYELTVTAGG